MTTREHTEIEKRILSILDKQFTKGMKTYGQTLVDCPDEDYDWNIMTMEELVDALSYQVKENLKLQKENGRLKRLEWRYKVKLDQMFNLIDQLKKELQDSGKYFYNK
jgi:hypothetical protein